jgi:hypothetical protein
MNRTKKQLLPGAAQKRMQPSRSYQSGRAGRLVSFITCRRQMRAGDSFTLETIVVECAETCKQVIRVWATLEDS